MIAKRVSVLVLIALVVGACDAAPVVEQAPTTPITEPKRPGKEPREPTLKTADDARHAAQLYGRRVEKRRVRWFAKQQGAEMAQGIKQSAVTTIDRLFDSTMEPDVVSYEVKKGGTLEAIANRFKLFHHEIEALNATLRLRQELPPGEHVVVYKRDPTVRSQSVGSPGAGSLEHAVPMLEGPGRSIYAARWKAWGTAATVAHIDYVLRQWARNFPKAPIVLVGNLSQRKGGHLPPHSSHQSGRDVDVSYIANWDGKSEVTWQKMNSQNLDAALTWELLRLFVDTDAVEVIFIDYELQRLLYDHAKSKHLFTDTQLKLWLQYPDGPNTRQRIIQHVPGHVDHIHIRFACRSSETRCIPSPTAPDVEYVAASDITSSPPPPASPPPSADPATPNAASNPTNPTSPTPATATQTAAANPPKPNQITAPQNLRDPLIALDEDDRAWLALPLPPLTR